MKFDLSKCVIKSFDVVFPLEPVMPTIFPLKPFSHLIINSLINTFKFSTKRWLFLSFFEDDKVKLAPFLYAWSIKSFPSNFSPFKAINKSFFLIFLLSIDMPFIGLSKFLSKKVLMTFKK